MAESNSDEGIAQLAERPQPFRARELARYGATRDRLSFILLPQLERLACGVYGRKGRAYPRIVVSAARVERGVACLHSALWLHGLIEDEPDQAWMCIGHKAWKPGPRALPNTQFIRTSHGFVREDLCLLTSWQVPATGLARTVVDFFRFQKRLGAHAARHALDLVLAAGGCTLREIDACAERSEMRYWTRLSG